MCGLDELGLHGRSGLTHVLSILDPDYPTPEVFKAFDDHDKLELRFHDAIEPSPGIQLPRRPTSLPYWNSGRASVTVTTTVPSSSSTAMSGFPARPRPWPC